MAQDYGAAQPIVDVARKAYDTVEKYLGDPSKPAGKVTNKMDSVPKDNPNRKAWEAATKFVAPEKAQSKKRTPRKRSR